MPYSQVTLDDVVTKDVSTINMFRTFSAPIDHSVGHLKNESNRDRQKAEGDWRRNEVLMVLWVLILCIASNRFIHSTDDHQKEHQEEHEDCDHRMSIFSCFLCDTHADNRQSGMSLFSLRFISRSSHYFF